LVAQSIDVSWDLDGMAMGATVLRPDGDGPFPAVVLVAGSGPTDRDWCSPLMPGTNGSGHLLAEAFAEAGIASLRYDKRASGPHLAENLPKLAGTLSMRSHLDELVAAVRTLAALDFVDASRIVGLGNSEGTIHVLHYVTSAQDIPFAGAVLVAPPGRPIRDVLLSQLAVQAAQIPGGADLMPLVEQAAARFSAGEQMNPDPALPESVRMVLASFETPANLPFARELWDESATPALARIRIPTLVLIGGKDLQVDATLDGDPLRHATEGMANVTFAFPPRANHVLKEDDRSPAEVAAAPGNCYNAPDAHLDPESLGTILGWLRALFDPTGTASPAD
jgi:pimeloyl-ACP methyl ester carboxylesterase